MGHFFGEDTVKNQELLEWLKEREEYSSFLKQHLLRAQAKRKSDADRKRSPRKFQQGESVFLKLQPYAQSSVANRQYPKLAMKFFGPFQIIGKIGQAAYKLQLLDHSLIHPVFHVSQLKEHVPDHTPV